MNFWRQISPRRAVADFMGQWQRPNPRRWQIMAVSIAATGSIMWVFVPKNQRVEPRPPEVTWITTFDESRTREEIIASNIANQRRKERLEALEAERLEYRKELYRELGRATGLDVDEMEREIAEKEAADRRAAETRQAPDAAAARGD